MSCAVRKAIGATLARTKRSDNDKSDESSKTPPRTARFLIRPRRQRQRPPKQDTALQIISRHPSWKSTAVQVVKTLSQVALFALVWQLKWYERQNRKAKTKNVRLDDITPYEAQSPSNRLIEQLNLFCTKSIMRAFKDTPPSEEEWRYSLSRRGRQCQTARYFLFLTTFLLLWAPLVSDDFEFSSHYFDYINFHGTLAEELYDMQASELLLSQVSLQAQVPCRTLSDSLANKCPRSPDLLDIKSASENFVAKRLSHWSRIAEKARSSLLCAHRTSALPLAGKEAQECTGSHAAEAEALR